MSLKVFTTEELLGALKNDPSNTMIIEKKKNEKKPNFTRSKRKAYSQKTTSYLYIRW
jgi:hypothetical protein